MDAFEPADRASCLLRDSDDACSHGESATGWTHVYEQLQPGRFHGTHFEAWLGPVQILYERVIGPFKYHGTAWPGSRMFLSFLEGSGEIHYGGRPVANQTLITSPWDTVERATCNRRCELLLVAVSESYLEQFTRQHAGRSFFRTGESDSSATLCSGNSHLVRAFEQQVATALRTIGLQPSLLNNRAAVSSLRESVLSAISEALVDRNGADARLPNSSTRSFVVEKAIAYIEAHVADPFSIADVCAAVRVSERTLRYSFEQVVGVTPSHYIRAMRLNGARRDLATGRRHTVESAAARWGFWHMGRFANYYRQSFGEHPSHTIQKATRGRGMSMTVADAFSQMDNLPALCMPA